MLYGAILLPFKNPLFINSILDEFTSAKIANKHKVFILYIQKFTTRGQRFAKANL